eukprot:CAMPEP_0201539472 /NCGR_PEP_ID=MMETSP0161_2-20130828/70425_1 /ASSEMBLY_ACC=CAM_ASM_000251 /TAXON_ID=180227 /ORGANISM="Neoparamoeba aestuarina, Strain SoJaBio B1-5/56/2" /LENGTH=342 /DNA_ID=CAMNT_0047946871 /DNA_START=62 /DNA_END=1090 /DNA_ORIENTATION=+
MALMRHEGGQEGRKGGEMVISYPGTKALMKAGIERTSELLAPTLLLEGHEGPVHACEFSADGNFLASASFDKTVGLWYIWGDCVHSNVFKGHKSAVLDVHFSPDGSRIFSCSADTNGMIWDVEAGVREKKMAGHQGIVNSICPGRRGSNLVLTCSDDCTARIWDVRVKGSVQVFKTNYQITSGAFSQTAEQIFTAGIDPTIACRDLRKDEIPIYTMEGHTDNVSCLSLSPNGNELLSNCMDNTVRIWDVRPFSKNRALRTINGVQHSNERNLLKCKWSPDGRSVSAGTSNRFVLIWNSVHGRLLHQLPGHKGAVWDVAFHPTQPIIASCSSDKTVFLGELTE